MKKIVTLSVSILTATLIFQVSAALTDDQFGGGEIAYSAPAKGVYFSHEVHVELGFECDSCHEGLFEMETGAAVKNGNFTMNAMGEGSYCGACHDGSTAFSLESSCSACHVEDGGAIHFTAPVESVRFGHQEHVEMGFDCSDCHNGMFEMSALEAQKGDFTMEALYRGEYCGACHDGSTAFASDTRCATCHIGVKGYDRAKKPAEKKAAKQH